MYMVLTKVVGEYDIHKHHTKNISGNVEVRWIEWIKGHCMTASMVSKSEMGSKFTVLSSTQIHQAREFGEIERDKILHCRYKTENNLSVKKVIYQVHVSTKQGIYSVPVSGCMIKDKDTVKSTFKTHFPNTTSTYLPINFFYLVKFLTPDSYFHSFLYLAVIKKI